MGNTYKIEIEGRLIAIILSCENILLILVNILFEPLKIIQENYR
jgi:hypothetical protein